MRKNSYVTNKDNSCCFMPVSVKIPIIALLKFNHYWSEEIC
jgi:hypothetical protein